MENDINAIILEDGSSIEGYPKAIKDAKPIRGELSIDTTGEYLIPAGCQPAPPDKEKEAERRRNNRLFYENAYLFLDNADKILSDSRLFLSEVKVQNGLAITGRSGLQHPTLGIYLEWWLNHALASHDVEGNPVWFISGSPLSGAHACSAVDSQGKAYDATLNGPFRETWESFMSVNNRYNDAKTRFIAYPLEEVVALLKSTHR